MFSLVKVGVVMVGLVVVVIILCFLFWGLLLFVLVVIFMFYFMVNVGICLMVSEVIFVLIWGVVFWYIFFLCLLLVLVLCYCFIECMLLWLMLFIVLLFVVGQVSIKVEVSGLLNWLCWLFNLFIVFFVGCLLVECKNCEILVIVLLLGILVMLLMFIVVFICYCLVLGMVLILVMFNYVNLDIFKFGLEVFFLWMGLLWMYFNVIGGIMVLLLFLVFCYGVVNQGWWCGLGFVVVVFGVVVIFFVSFCGVMFSLVVVLFWMFLCKVFYIGCLLLFGVGLVVVLVFSYLLLQECLVIIFLLQNVSIEVCFDEYWMFFKVVVCYLLGIGFKVDLLVLGIDFLGIFNLWLNFMYKVGFGGMLLFIVVIWCWWCEVCLEKGLICLICDNVIWLGSMGGILVVLVSGLFDYYFSFVVVMIGLFWLLVGINLLEVCWLFLECQL